MTGPRLVTGLVTMGVVAPLILFLLLGLQDFRELTILSATCFSLWGVADLIGSILSKPRLRNRSPVDAIKSIENLQKRSGDAESAPTIPEEQTSDQA